MKIKGSGSLRFILAISALIAILTASSIAATEKVLHSFNPALVHGQGPESALVSDAAGNLYGTTYYGGEYYWGIVYKLAPNSSGGWTQTVLYSFKGNGDGCSPAAALVIDAQGNLYGTTLKGGVGSNCSGYGTVFELSPTSKGGWKETVLYSFHGGNDGAEPNGLVLDPAGNLYGTTFGSNNTGCNTGCGTAFQLTRNSAGGWSETILHSFGTGSDGAHPTASLVSDAAGNLYGTTQNGGTSGYGTVFELMPGPQGTWVESVLYSFSGGADGSTPEGTVVVNSAGNIYGAAYYGGGFSSGAVFELKPNGNSTWNESVLYSFGATPGDGLNPLSVVLDNSGNLYGTTGSGGGMTTVCYPGNGCGTVFQLTQISGGQWTETILHSFTGHDDGAVPSGGLILGPGGNLYGTTVGGGAAGLGAVFKLSMNAGQWQQSTIYWFPGNNGWDTTAGLVSDNAGNLYGTLYQGGLYLGGAVFKLSPNGNGGWTSELIYSFRGEPDGSRPVSGLVFDSSGNLYGTTAYGGMGCLQVGGCGTAFRLSPSATGTWSETVLHSFTGGSDGRHPYGGITVSQGNLFGTTLEGGSQNCGFFGCGTVFELTPSSGGQYTEKILYSFTGGPDGEYPVYENLAVDAAGNLYGTTATVGYGTVFELSPNGSGGWTKRTIYIFASGGSPATGVILDQSGNLFGTSEYPNLCCGTAFELTPSAGTWSRSILYDFISNASGLVPYGGVVFDSTGNLYGTTSQGGNSACNCGLVYKLSPASGALWTETVLHVFDSSTGDGGVPYGNLTLDSAGNLYGTTIGGGTYGYGTVYEVTP
jgi:uncharacterized repeat protein (TIGR03803 family)